MGWRWTAFCEKLFSHVNVTSRITKAVRSRGGICCLRAEDRQTTAARLDHFDPFLDHRLIELMFRVPGRLKIQGGVTKRLLRTATRGLLPEATRTRIAKTGWNAPAHVWFTGAGAERLRGLVGSRAFRERGIYHTGEVEKLIDEHEAIVASGEARENHMMFLWQLVNLELWLQSWTGSQTRVSRAAIRHRNVLCKDCRE